MTNRDEYPLLFSTCQVVADHQKIELMKPPVSAESGDLFEYIYKIAEATDIRCRKVALSGQWWNKDCGPLLSFYKNDPCALLPKKNGGYQLVDLKRGRRVRVSQKMAGQLSAYAFYFYPPLPLPENIQTLKDLFKFSLMKVKNDFWRFLRMQAMISVLSLAVPISLGYLFNVVIPNADVLLLWQVIALLFMNTVVITLFCIAQTSVLIHFRFKLEAITTPAIWDRILKLPLQFLRRYSVGDLIFRARAITDVQNTATQSVLFSLANGFSAICLLILLFYYSAGLAVVSLLLAFSILTGIFFLNYRQFVSMRLLYGYFGRFIGFIFEIISGISKIRVANATSRTFRLWGDQLAKKSKVEWSVQSYRLKTEVWIALMTLINPLVFYAVAERLGSGLSFGDFLAFNVAYSLFFAMLLKMAADLGDAVWLFPLWQKARPIVVSKMECEVGYADPGELSGDIVMKNIVFRYHAEDQPLFKDFSLSIRPGEFVAVVGPSGSGKSTLFRLMLRFEEAESGSIYYDGMEFRTLKLAAVRKQIGVVIQNSALIPGTIFTNIAGHTSKITRTDAWEMAEKVGLSEFIKYLPMQMDTVISGGGMTLSGGEIQKLILARALAQKPKILILDEATSALDNTTQAVVHHYLKQLHATQIIAAHRLSTIVNADRIVVIEKGTIVQQGAFSDLISQPGLFSQMAKRQL